jgi:hypothetical protein
MKRYLVVALRGVVILAMAAGSFYGLGQLASGESGDLLPLPPSPSPPTDYPPVSGDGIELWKPLAEQVEVPIGSLLYTVPAGATVVGRIEGTLVLDPTTGEVTGDVPEHPAYFIVSRNESRVHIDEGTGAIFLWEVQPVDEADFAPLLSPTSAVEGPQ